MSDEDALLAAVAAAPGDDTVRLAYADFLAERAGAMDCFREQLIRLQIGEERGEFPACDRFYHMQGCACPACELAKMEQRLDHLAGGADVRVDYRRGFPAVVTCTTGAWLTRGRDLVLLHPLERVTLSDKTPAPFTSAVRPDLVTSYDWWDVYPSSREDRGDLPTVLFRAVDAACPGHAHPIAGDCLAFATATEADDALSAGCLHWARADEEHP